MSANPPEMSHVDFDSDVFKITLSLRFAADVQKLDNICGAIMKLVGTMECACGHEQEIELALTEALANAIRHGAGSDPSKMIECRVGCDDTHGILVIVSDPGHGFDPGSIANPLVGENLYSEHGRGIFLINQLMDQVEFKSGGTEIRMRKFVKKPVSEKTCGL